MPDHICDKALTIENHGRQISDLYEQGRDREARMTEIETVLFGAERNGGGFIRETKETMEIIRIGVNTLSNQVKDLCDKKSGKQEIMGKLLPALVGLASAVIVALVSRGVIG